MIRKQTVASLFARFAKEEEQISKRAAEIRGELEQLEERLAEVRVIRKALEAQAGGAPAPKAPGRKPGRKPAAKAAAPVAEAEAAPAKAPRTKKAAAPKAPRAKKAAAKKPAAPKAAKPAKPAKAAKPAKPAKAAKPAAKADGRKGRRKATAKGIHALGIVDAAFELARQKGVREANAGDVIAWFEEVGYKTRDGVPNRNSVYVSLNRESTEGPAKGRNKVTRPEKGKFAFHWDAASPA